VKKNKVPFNGPARLALALSLGFLLLGGFLTLFLHGSGDDAQALGTAHGTLMVFFGMGPFFIGFLTRTVRPVHRGGLSSLSFLLWILGGAAACAAFLAGPTRFGFWLGAVLAALSAAALEGFRFLRAPSARDESATSYSLRWASLQAVLALPLAVTALAQRAGAFPSDLDGSWFWLFTHPAAFLILTVSLGVATDLLADSTGAPLGASPVIRLGLAGLSLLGTLTGLHHALGKSLGPALTDGFRVFATYGGLPLLLVASVWAAALWRSTPRQDPASWAGLAFMALLLTGGLSGIFLMGWPGRWEGSTAVTAHFHYLVFGGSLFAATGYLYRRFEELTGRPADRVLAAIHLGGTFTGFHLAFFPMFLKGAGYASPGLDASLGVGILSLAVFQALFAFHFLRGFTGLSLAEAKT